MSLKHQKLYNKLVSVTTRNNSNIFLRLICFSTPEGSTDDIPVHPMTSTPVNKPSAIKSLCIFTNILDVKNKTDTCQVGAAKSKRKAIKYRTTP